jgi:hypothetical protein
MQPPKAVGISREPGGELREVHRAVDRGLWRRHCDAKLPNQIDYSGEMDTPNSSLFNDDYILAILADVETESGISWEPLSVHPCEHRALTVDVIVDFNG